MSFEKKTWYDDGVLPGDAPEGAVAPCLDADNMNRLEEGIVEALEKIDKNILHFTGNTNMDYEAGLRKNDFYIPEDVDLNKYEVFFCSDSPASYCAERAIVYLPKDKSVDLVNDNGFSYVDAYLSSESRMIRISQGRSMGSDFTRSFDLFLIPMAQAIELTRVEVE